eukprot:30114-Pyramimonas_sp.AAC.1
MAHEALQVCGLVTFASRSPCCRAGRVTFALRSPCCRAGWVILASRFPCGRGGRRLPPEDRNLALRALLRAAFFARYDGSFYESGVKHTVEAVDAELHLALQNRPSGNVPLVLE